MSSEIPPPVKQQIEAALFAGRKIEAIKLYRDETSLGLAEAKNAVEDIEVQLRKISPERFISAPAGKGCGSAAVLLLAAGFWLLGLFVLAAHWYFKSGF